MDKTKKATVTIIKNGPYLVSGSIPLAKEIAQVGKSEEPENWKKGEKFPKKESYALCRCGKSNTKPFCDGSHVSAKFNGKETASKNLFISIANKISGKELELLDVHSLCSAAKFCHLAGGTWKNVENSGDAKCKKIAIQTAGNCPSGRLVIIDKKTKKAIEPKFNKSISVIEDKPAKVSGPLWLKGGIELKSEDGSAYECRNRMTICRCGKSKNKPFCDASHLDINFNDGDKNLK